jgi:prepilin-type N-terminal cleavage/methylation domain-containing protein
MNKNHAFTLIELLVVIVMGTTIPRYRRFKWHRLLIKRQFYL